MSSTFEKSLLQAAEFKPESLQLPISWAGHIPFANWITNYTKPAILVELGTHSGNSYFTFCQAVALADLGTKCFAVDTWQGDQHSGAYEDDIYQQVYQYNSLKYNSFSELMRMTFDDAAEAFADASIDLLHIDGLHTYEAVRHDYEKWLPKLSPGAVVMLHDTNVFDRDFGVHRFWQEIKRIYPVHLEFDHSSGLGVFQLPGARVDKSLQAISDNPPYRECLVKYFTALGMTLVDNHGRPMVRQQQIDELREEVQRHQQVLVEREILISLLNQQLAELKLHAQERDKQLAQRDEQLVQRDEQLVQRDEQLVQRDEQLVQRDEQLAILDRVMKETYASRSWKVTAPLRFLGGKLRVFLGYRKILQELIINNSGFYNVVKKLVYVVRREGMAGLRHRLKNHIIMSNSDRSIQQQGLRLHRKKIKVIPYYIDKNFKTNSIESSKKISMAIHLHLYYVDMLNIFLDRLKNILHPFSLYISVPENQLIEKIKATCQEALPKTVVIIVEAVPNRGRDIAPLIVQFGQRLSEYDVVAHFHTKKSPHCPQLDEWCLHILDLLLGTEHEGGHVTQILDLLQTGAKVVYPEGQTQIIKDYTGWGANHAIAQNILSKYSQLNIADFPIVDFPEGSMFWARGAAVRDFITLPLGWEDFPAEPVPADGTLAHALERLILVFARNSPGEFYRLHQGDSIPDYRYYEEQRDFSTLKKKQIKILTYYLPQFHTIPENDLWHGQGFTEWTKVRSANPLFEGQYQQHIPHSDIGYYQLDHPDILRRQADMMAKAGVFGQIFYHYWFSGKLILEQPAQLLLQHPDINMPFCFCWANENWTRRWDGNEEDILLGQRYSAADARDFIEYLIPFFRDSRYIRIEDRPVLFVYRPASIPDPGQYLEVWRQICSENSIPEPYVIAVLTRGAADPRDFAMDAGVERVLHDWTAGSVADISKDLISYQPLEGSILPYEKVVDFYSSQAESKDFTWFRSLVPMWDNTARYQQKAFALHGSNPDLFARWLRSSVDYTLDNLPEDRRFVVINAWNEWAEGAHVEPDSRYGYAWLNTIGRTLTQQDSSSFVNPQVDLPAELCIRLVVFPEVLSQLELDSQLHKQFWGGLKRSSLFGRCEMVSEHSELKEVTSSSSHDGSKLPDYTIQFRRAALFAPDVLEKMVMTAIYSTGSVVISNVYDYLSPLVEALDNGSVVPEDVYPAPIVCFPRPSVAGYKNYRLRFDAKSFIVEPNTLGAKKLPCVTTIVRYHQAGNLSLLQNALLSLAAMKNCRVIPLIAAQNLDPSRTREVERLLQSIPWPSDVRPRLHHYRSTDKNSDLRARMLTESLKLVNTKYAAFLDYDDLVFAHAYEWMIGRLIKTGKAVTFGRVYSTRHCVDSGRFWHRQKEFVEGRDYEQFLQLNHAPLHSIMFDISQLDLEYLEYHDEQCYLEDYFLTLQLISSENTDWLSLNENYYVGDYLHSDCGNTLATIDKREHVSITSSVSYGECEKRVNDLRKRLHQKSKTSMDRVSL